jgi:hypothetical protein
VAPVIDQSLRFRTYTDLHEPGKNFAGKPPVPVGPQSHIWITLPPAVGNVQLAKVVASLFEQPLSWIEPDALPPKFWVNTVTMPAPVVVTLATYLLVAEALSQPQGLVAVVAGSVGEVWTASLIEVRQVEAARITSDTLALTV